MRLSYLYIGHSYASEGNIFYTETATWSVKKYDSILKFIYWFFPEHWYQVTPCVICFARLIMSHLYFHNSSVILQADSKSWSEVIPLNPLTSPVSIIYKANTYICQKLCQVVTHTCSWHLQWQNISPGIQGTMIYHLDLQAISNHSWHMKWQKLWQICKLVKFDYY